VSEHCADIRAIYLGVGLSGIVSLLAGAEEVCFLEFLVLAMAKILI
jgi:hypothetical protein